MPSGSKHEGTRNGKVTHSTRRNLLKASTVPIVGLAGCVGDGDDEASPSPQTKTTARQEPELADEINIYTYGGDNARVKGAGYIESFEDEYGVSVNHRTMASEFDVIPKIENDAVTAHVVESTAFGTLSGIDRGIWAPIRLDNIPLAEENIIPQFRGDSDYTTYDPGDEWYTIPYEIYAEGLVYNNTRVDEPQSWQDIYTEELKGQHANTAFVFLAMGVAASEIGVNFNDIKNDPSLADDIFERIGFQNDYVHQWWSSASTAAQLFTNESALVGNYWYGRVIALREQEGVPISYTIPEEGSVHGVSANNIGVKEDPDRYTAELYLNHLAKPGPSSFVAQSLPYYQPFTFDGEEVPPNAPKTYVENPDRTDFDNLSMWDYPFYNQNATDWRNRFQETISG